MCATSVKTPPKISASAPRLRPLILGTAGHIDHGKTSLVKALTGIDADRLPEEQARGMTIDLGFAHLELAGRKIGIVDVPGHEKFIRNMVAGATGIDLVVLVVAADDAVMPQTREHLEIIDLLGVSGGIVALNKCDLADEAQIARAENAIRALIKGTCLDGAPIVRVSAGTGLGIERLRAEISEQIAFANLAEWPPLFRLPIDRRFTLQGHGTVVTGSLMGGDVSASEEAELMPQGRRVRVRSAQSHGGVHSGLDSGRRVAVNIAGLKLSQIERGDELAAIGYLAPANRIAARIRVLRSAPLVIESHKVLRLHIGTRHVDARIALIGRNEIEPGESAAAILQTDAEICAAHGQRFILRSAPHGVTVGGGSVVMTCPPKVKLTGGVPAWFDAIERGEPKAKLLAALEIEPKLGGNLRALYRETGVAPDEAERLLKELADEGKILRTPGAKDSGFWTRDYVAQCKTEIVERMRGILDRTRPRASVEPGALLRATGALGPAELIQWLLAELERENQIAQRRNQWTLIGYEPELQPGERDDLARLLAAYERASYATPTRGEAAAAAKLSDAKSDTLHAYAIDTGKLIPITPEMSMHGQVHERLLDDLRKLFSAGRGLTVSEIKDALKISRKYAIPLCEYLDRQQYTKRQGDLRIGGEALKNF